MYRHSGPLSRDQRRGGNAGYKASGPLSKGQRGGGNIVYRHSGPLYEGQRRGGRQCTDTQDLDLRSEGWLETVYRHS